jgi:hypothetical protein
MYASGESATQWDLARTPMKLTHRKCIGSRQRPGGSNTRGIFGSELALEIHYRTLFLPRSGPAACAEQSSRYTKWMFPLYLSFRVYH